MKISFLKIISISLSLFMILVFFLALNIDKRYSTEKIVGKELENFEIKFLLKNDMFRKDNLTNESYHLFNIWASWCLPCKKEHPFLMSLKKENNLKLIGINFKDKNFNAKNFLKELGNPYEISLSDNDGTSSVIFGVYGVPESILINKEHKIIKKFIGPLNTQDYRNILKLINEK
ncbi:redoxin family protein [Pelagibacteraceae bacterium]|nr:redoxin family protein [Pelagibacteraceae bacterium]